MNRILNAEQLVSHGNERGRQVLVQILEAGLRAADPYFNTIKLLRVEGKRLIVGGPPDFDPDGALKTGEEVFDLDEVGRILVVGAGKGVQRVAKAIEEVLGERLEGGVVIAKHGDEAILERIEVVFGAHPVPDEGCVEGCRKMMALLQGLEPEDLVFTIAANGVSALLTMPVPGVTLDDVRDVTYKMQIERGVFTGDLNPIRNHLDMMKGGRISRYLQPAMAVHILAVSPGECGDYDGLMERNAWLHTLPECTTYARAVDNLKRYDAWDDVAPAVCDWLERADPAYETVKREEFEKGRFRIFGVMPVHWGMRPTAARKAAELGFTPHILYHAMHADAGQVAQVIAAMALNCEATGEPFEPPCALIGGSEMLVTVGKGRGMGGRNQEFALTAAGRIAGSENILISSVDSDGTDGPGRQFHAVGDIPDLAGAIVDGTTMERAQAAGIDVPAELADHNTSPALWALDDAILATHNISINDLMVTLVLGRKGE